MTGMMAPFSGINRVTSIGPAGSGYRGIGTSGLRNFGTSVTALVRQPQWTLGPCDVPVASELAAVFPEHSHQFEPEFLMQRLGRRVGHGEARNDPMDILTFNRLKQR